MTRFFIIVSLMMLLSGGITNSVSAMGVNDFVAVADAPGSAVYNPAGLTALEGRSLFLEHRFTGRELAFGSDDLLVYSVSEPGGTGALFFNYNQDNLSENLYNRVQALGYAYGWTPSKKIALGVSAKFSKYGIYNNGTELESKANLLLDFGMLAKTSTPWQFGMAVHNLGRNESVEAINYQLTAGCAYRGEKIVLAAEIYDLLDEGGDTPLEGSLLRVGGRFKLNSQLRLHLVVEDSMTDWNYSGSMVGFEYMTPIFSANISWYQAEGDYIDNDTIQATVMYHF